MSKAAGQQARFPLKRIAGTEGGGELNFILRMRNVEDRRKALTAFGHTLIAKKRVSAMEVKYAAVNGSLGVEIRCSRYVHGPIRTAHDVKNKTEPKDHLHQNTDKLAWSTSLKLWP